MLAVLAAMRWSSVGFVDHDASFKHQALPSQACVDDGQHALGEFVYVQQVPKKQSALMAIDEC